MLSAIYTMLKEGIFNTKDTEKYLSFVRDDRRGIYLIRIYGKDFNKIHEFDQFTPIGDLIEIMKEEGYIRDDIGLPNAVSSTGVVHGVYEEEGKGVWRSVTCRNILDGVSILNRKHGRGQSNL